LYEAPSPCKPCLDVHMPLHMPCGSRVQSPLKAIETARCLIRTAGSLDPVKKCSCAALPLAHKLWRGNAPCCAKKLYYWPRVQAEYLPEGAGEAERGSLVRSALEELEQLLARTRAVEASLAAVPLPACSGADAGNLWWDAPLAHRADAHAHVVVTCAPAARSDRGWAAPEKQCAREAAAAEPAVQPACCWEAPCPRGADIRHCSAPNAGSCQDPAHAARAAAPLAGPTAGQRPRGGDPLAPSVRIRCEYDDRAAPAAPRAEASRRLPRAHGCAAAGRPPAWPPLGRRRCGVPRSPLEAALWRLADAEDAWAAERAGARREAEELRKRAARLERELRHLQARALPARQ